MSPLCRAIMPCLQLVVDFASSEDFQKALKKNKQLFRGEAVEVVAVPVSVSGTGGFGGGFGVGRGSRGAHSTSRGGRRNSKRGQGRGSARH